METFSPAKPLLYRDNCCSRVGPAPAPVPRGFRKLPKPGWPNGPGRRDESRRGTQECVRHNRMRRFRTDSRGRLGDVRYQTEPCSSAIGPVMPCGTREPTSRRNLTSLRKQTRGPKPRGPAGLRVCKKTSSFRRPKGILELTACSRARLRNNRFPPAGAATAMPTARCWKCAESRLLQFVEEAAHLSELLVAMFH